MPNPDGTPTIQEQIDNAIAPYKDKASQWDNQSSEQDNLNKKIESIYGSSAGNVGKYTDQYMGGVLGNLDKNVASADYLNQQSGQSRGISQARAGLSGTSTSGADEQSKRNALFGAAGINEAAKREANQTLGKAAGGIATGINKIEQNANANRIASMGTPLPPEQTGLFGGTGFLGLGI